MGDPILVAHVGDIEDEEAIVVGADKTGLADIAVFFSGGEYFALNDECTHEVASLADGYIDGDVVECPLHSAKFSLRTGDVLMLPATAPLCTHKVEVRGDEIWLYPGVPVAGAVLS